MQPVHCNLMLYSLLGWPAEWDQSFPMHQGFNRSPVCLKCLAHKCTGESSSYWLKHLHSKPSKTSRVPALQRADTGLDRGKLYCSFPQSLEFKEERKGQQHSHHCLQFQPAPLPLGGNAVPSPPCSHFESAR